MSPSVHRRALKSYEPLASIYKLFAFATTLARIPLYLVFFAVFPSRRPHKTWSLLQALMVRVARHLVDMGSATETPVPLSLKPSSAEGDRFRVLEPYPSTFYQGVLASSPDVPVTPARIGGVWYYPDKKQQGALSAASLGPNDAVILHLHGGAFIMGDGRPEYMGHLVKTWLTGAKPAAIFCPSYRLACRPGDDPFPAALQDSLTSYLYLVRTLGIPAKNVVLSGDSAGGNLVAGLLRYLAEHGSDLPEKIANPAAAVMQSPWINLDRLVGPDAEAYVTNNPHYQSDMIPASFPIWGARVYSRFIGAENPYITPLDNPFATPVPMFVNYGTAELLEIDGLEWVRQMVAVSGNTVRLNHEPAAPHDTALIGDKLFYQESSLEVARRAGEFMREFVGKD